MPIALLLCLLAAVPEALPAWEVGELEVIGWSADEKTLAFTFGPENRLKPAELTEDLFRGCDGEKPDAFSILIVHANGTSERYPIQDGKPCTPDEEASKRLGSAKAAMKQAGIGAAAGKSFRFHAERDGSFFARDDAFKLVVKRSLSSGSRDSEEAGLRGEMWLSVSGKEGRHLEFSQRTNGNTGDRAYVEPGPVFVSQDTVGEWRRSGSTKTCVECHFPKAAHRTRGGHDLPLLQQTLSVSWSGRCAVVEAKGAGHAVPTGDPFHFLRLSLCRDAACSKRLASQSLVRRMKEGPDGKLVAESDTRPQPTQRLCFEPTRATHWVLELRHAEYLVDDQAPEDERWKVIHTGALPKP